MTERVIFAAALRKSDAAERAAFLDAACTGDAELREHVETLLAEHDRLGGFLESPGCSFFLGSPDAEQPGMQVGPYKLVQEIGEGGCGIVFLAEQRTPVHRQVAIKVIKPGMDTRQVTARFEAERQALAMMDHPNIARVLDAGATESGRPYFVMELMRGVPITTYCEEGDVPIRHRLELFVSVCRAIQHAHNKGIIHRDIKPSNVLITIQDGEPVVKVIDFGIAKAIGQQLTEATLLTCTLQMMGTPLYMSPEQAELGATDIDTRSDIYSLGVLLYELLTGTTPFDREQWKQKSFDEIRRIIREDEPPKPSARIRMVARQHLELVRFKKHVRGELDWIVMKALEKDRGRRYETANGLALDVQRYLADEPVQAWPPSARYRVHKFVRRHKTGVLVAALSLSLLVVAGVAAGWLVRDRGARRAEAATRVESALQEAARLVAQQDWRGTRAAAQRADELLSDANDLPELRRRLEILRHDLQMVDRLERIAESQLMERDEFWNPTAADQDYEAAFREYGIDVLHLDPAVASERLKASVIVEQLTHALDNWAWIILGNAHRGERVRAVTCLVDPDPWRIRFRAAVVQHDRQALEELANLPAAELQPPMIVTFLGRTLNSLGAPEKAVDVLTAAHRHHPEHFWLNVQLGSILRWGVKPPRNLESAGYMRAALASRPQALRVRLELGGSLLSQKHADEAIAHFRRVLEIQPDYAHPHHSLGQAFALKGAWSEAIESYQTCLRGNVRPSLACQVYHDMGKAFQALGDMDRAIANWQTSVQLEPKYYWAQQELGYAFVKQGKMEEALAAFRKVLALNGKSAIAHVNVGWMLGWQGKWDESISYSRKALELDPNCDSAHNNLGWALLNQGKANEAIEPLRQALAIEPNYLEANINLGKALHQQRRMVEAIPVWKQIVKLSPNSASTHSKLAWVLSTTSEISARDPVAAVFHGQKAVELDPSANRWSNLGVAQWRAGEVSAAIQSLEKADSLCCGDYAHRFFLAMAYWQNGEPEKARESYEQGVNWMEANQPDNEDLLRFRAEAEELMQQTSRYKIPSPAT